MYFKRIDMHGFKSFAEPVSIDFHEGITCIVGPNGSGKSNISDAIRWVLGEQSPKMLRGGKMEEVIFSGTASRKSRGMAEVTLVLDNSKGILPIDYAEVAITRRMYRSGESEYYINNNSCRLRDIRELIMDTGIGVDGYSIIGQGKISDIVGNKPESRREIFEEAAGIVKYRSKKAEAERKLESTAHNLERVNDIASEIESRIGQLREDSEKASEFIILRDRYKKNEINITLKNIESIELKNEYMKDDLMELESQIDRYKDQKTALDEDIDNNRNRSEELDRLGIETRDNLLIHVEEINSLVNQGQLNAEKQATIDKDTERLQEEILNLDSKAEKESTNRHELLKTLAETEATISELSASLTSKSEQFEAMAGALDKQTAKIESGKNRIYELHSLAMGKNSEKASLETLLETLSRRKQQIEGERILSDSSSQNTEASQQELLKQRDSTAAALRTLEDNRSEKNAALKLLKDKEWKTGKDLENNRLLSGETTARKKIIEELENAYEGYNNAVKFVMKNLSSMAGIHGVVADLIQVPAGFETAIETALGAGLQNVVCENDNSAKGAIDKLKANKAGRLTFLPLASIRSSKASFGPEMEKAEGFKGLGVSCVSFDPKYATIMEYLLGRVIIVDNLDHAILLSKKAGNGLRFVTLEGEVINSGGAITGGNFRSSGPNLLERKSEIKNLEEKIAALVKEQTILNGALVALSADRTSLEQVLGSLESSFRQTEIALLNLENDLRRLENQLTDFRTNDQKWHRELESIEEEKKSAAAMINVLIAASDQAVNERKELEILTDEDMLSQGDNKVKVEGLRHEITDIKLALGSSESEKNNILSIAGRIESYLSDLAMEKNDRLQMLEILKKTRSEINLGDGQLAEEIAGKEAAREEFEAYLRENQHEKELIQGYLKEIISKREALDENLGGFQSEKYELDLKLARNEAQVEGYKEKLWEEFEISYIQAIDFKSHDFNMAAAQRESREIKNRIKELGEVNIGAIKEYETVSERYEFLTVQRRDLLEAIASLKKIIDDMDRTIKMNFKESFDKIAANFGAAFMELFGGGSAELRLEDDSRPLECGIEIIAQPPGKKLQNINLLSGGEKTMTAIALMFAVLKAKPTPFCILDEVEAALDDSNINRFAEYLKNFKEIQFALVTHQKATMEYADILYGVTMPEQGISKVLSLKLSSIA